jgi:hypothetical protein
MMRHTPPDEESRKLDIHACKADMNIKFPVFLVGSKAVIQKRACYLSVISLK